MVSGTYPQKYRTYPQNDGQQIDMMGNYVIGFPMNQMLHASLTQGSTDVALSTMSAGIFTQNRRWMRVAVCVDTAPGAGKSVAVSLSNGTSTMTATISGTDTCGYADSPTFDWVAATETMTLSYSETAGGASTKVHIAMKYVYIDTP